LPISPPPFLSMCRGCGFCASSRPFFPLANVRSLFSRRRNSRNFIVRDHGTLNTIPRCFCSRSFFLFFPWIEVPLPLGRHNFALRANFTFRVKDNFSMFNPFPPSATSHLFPLCRGNRFCEFAVQDRTSVGCGFVLPPSANIVPFFHQPLLRNSPPTLQTRSLKYPSPDINPIFPIKPLFAAFPSL